MAVRGLPRAGRSRVIRGRLMLGRLVRGGITAGPVTRPSGAPEGPSRARWVAIGATTRPAYGVWLPSERSITPSGGGASGSACIGARSCRALRRPSVRPWGRVGEGPIVPTQAGASATTLACVLSLRAVERGPFVTHLGATMRPQVSPSCRPHVIAIGRAAGWAFIRLWGVKGG